MNFRKVLGNKQFVRLWIAQFVSFFGDFIAIYAVYAAITFRMHGSASQVSGIMIAFLAPFALMGPLAGVFVDRWNVKRTMIASDLARALLCLGLIVAATPWHIYAILFSLSAVSTFFMPAQSVTLPLLVDREDLLSAGALMQQTIQIVRILSPAAAAALVGLAGEQSCYWIDSASYVASALLLMTLAIHRPVVPVAVKTVKGVLSDLGSGFKFILTHPSISFVIISLTVGMFATGCFTALLAVYVRDVLHEGTKTFGLLGSLIGIGTMSGGIAVMKFKDRSRAHMVSLGMFLMGGFIGLMAFAGSTIATFACTFGLGLGVAFILIPSMTLLQEATPNEMRGRVTSTSTSMFTLSQGIALLISGALAARLGIVPIFYASAVILILVGVVGWWKLSSIEKPAAAPVDPIMAKEAIAGAEGSAEIS